MQIESLLLHAFDPTRVIHVFAKFHFPDLAYNTLIALSIGTSSIDISKMTVRSLHVRIKSFNGCTEVSISSLISVGDDVR